MSLTLIKRIPEPIDARYHATYTALYSRVKKEMEEKAFPIMANSLNFPIPGNSALEIACGAGIYAYALASQSNLNVLATDIDSSALALGRNWYGGTPRLSFEIMNAYNMKYENKFGMIIINDALHHFDDLPKLLQLIYNALLPSGVFYFTDFTRMATVGDQNVMSIVNLRKQMSEKRFVQAFLDNGIIAGGDPIKNQRILLAINSILAAYTTDEISSTLQQIGFENTTIGETGNGQFTGVTLKPKKD